MDSTSIKAGNEAAVGIATMVSMRSWKSSWVGLSPVSNELVGTAFVRKLTDYTVTALRALRPLDRAGSLVAALRGLAFRLAGSVGTLLL